MLRCLCIDCRNDIALARMARRQVGGAEAARLSMWWNHVDHDCERCREGVIAGLVEEC